ncbi:hypothetical protein HPB50_010691 [Hyalomma asiaticum]|uniref:Uncharacterized protein n=1 Tax=Hyalomma asiaticum TaxID=266040 RepID=A0ACB7SE88_HYAAI|nr:hypothetical protein HPB50_010691 [Hyalomma asiaticum]
MRGATTTLFNPPRATAWGCTVPNTELNGTEEDGAAAAARTAAGVSVRSGVASAYTRMTRAFHNGGPAKRRRRHALTAQVFHGDGIAGGGGDSTVQRAFVEKKRTEKKKEEKNETEEGKTL